MIRLVDTRHVIRIKQFFSQEGLSFQVNAPEGGGCFKISALEENFALFVWKIAYFASLSYGFNAHLHTFLISVLAHMGINLAKL